MLRHLGGLWKLEEEKEEAKVDSRYLLEATLSTKVDGWLMPMPMFILMLHNANSSQANGKVHIHALTDMHLSQPRAESADNNM
ncbi:hypothetical protein EAE99_005876 [Botrytis elliptica]|nr:hypothetical protein EAE99_005876 [Botrytis elliptica]